MLTVFYKRFSLLFLLFITINCVVFGQVDKKDDYIREARKEDNQFSDFTKRLYWGGNVGAWIGNPTFVDLSPLVGLRVTDKFSVGVGAIYNYYSYRYFNTKYSTNLWGSRLFGRYFILENIFAQVGWDRINRDNPYSNLPNSRVWIDNLLVGGGLRYPVSDRFFMIASGFWNLNQTPLSPYANPIIQIGFIGGF